MKFLRYILCAIVCGTVLTSCGGGGFSTISEVVTTPAVTTTTLEHIPAFNLPLPSGWTQTGWTIGGGQASGVAGASINANNAFGLDLRTITWQFQLNSAGTDLSFYTRPVEPSVYWGSALRVDMATNELWISSVNGGIGQCVGVPGCVLGSFIPITPNIKVAVIPFTLALNHTYTLTWTRVSNLTFTATLTDPATGQSVTLSRTTATFGYNPYPTGFCDQGDMEGGSGAYIWVGSATLLNYDNSTPVSPTPTLYILGDSITDDFGNQPDSAKFGSLLRNTLGASQVVVSGIPGAIAGGALQRMQTELTNIKPKNVLIYLGTNTEPNFAAALNTLVATAQATGANVLVATVPTDATHTAIINALKGVTVVHFDLALTSGGAGTALLPAMYNNTDIDGNPYNDSEHPNVAGHAAMAARVLQDAPFLKQ